MHMPRPPLSTRISAMPWTDRHRRPITLISGIGTRRCVWPAPKRPSFFKGHNWPTRPFRHCGRGSGNLPPLLCPSLPRTRAAPAAPEMWCPDGPWERRWCLRRVRGGPLPGGLFQCGLWAWTPAAMTPRSLRTFAIAADAPGPPPSPTHRGTPPNTSEGGRSSSATPHRRAMPRDTNTKHRTVSPRPLQTALHPVCPPAPHRIPGKPAPVQQPLSAALRLHGRRLTDSARVRRPSPLLFPVRLLTLDSVFFSVCVLSDVV